LVKINDTGKIEWKKNYGGSQSEGTNSKVLNSKEGGYLVLGLSNSFDLDGAGNHGGSDIMIIKVNDTGKVIWNNMYGSNDADGFRDAFQKIDSSYMILGSAKNISGSVISSTYAPNWLFRISKDSVYNNSTSVAALNSENNFQVFPTLTDDEFTIEKNNSTNKAILYLTDMFGKKLLQKKLTSPKQTTTISLKQFPPGMYFLKIYADEKVYSYKVIRK